MQNSKSKRILFLSLSGIGNLIMQLSVIKAVKNAHPDWYITVWVAPRGTKELAQGQSYIDEVIEAPISIFSAPRGALAKWGLRGASIIMTHLKNILQIRAHHFDIAIVLSPGQLVKSALILFLSGISIRIGNSYPLYNNKQSRMFLTSAISELSETHDIEQNMRLLKPLKIPYGPVDYYSIEIPKAYKTEAERILLSISYKALPAGRQVKPTSYIGIHAGCAKGFEWKQWPLERFAEVAKAIIRNNPATRILVFGGPSEQEQKEQLVEMINYAITPGVDDKTPGVNDVAIPISASLLTTGALMEHCLFVLANDSGLMHLSASVGTPTIGLFGPTNEALTGPRGPHSIVIRADGTKPVYDTESAKSLGATSHSTMLAITTRMVFDKINQMAV